MSDQLTYSDAGVNIELGDDVSKVMFEAAQASWENRQGTLGEIISPFEDFTGIRVIDVSELPKGTVMCMGFDTVGTKTEIAERMNKHHTVAFDLFAMVCDDAIVRGGEPVLIGTNFEVNSLGTERESYLNQMKQVAAGYVNAAKEANVAIINGEVAEIGKRVGGFGPFNYNWGAAVIWFAKKERMFTGKETKPGDSIVAFEEEGFRSNGISLVRKILSNEYGGNWHEEVIEELFGEKSLGELALTPSRIYSKCACDIFGGYDREPKAEVHGIVHITGGGVPGKLGRVLQPSGLGAHLTELMEPCPLMLHCQEKGNVQDEEAYKTWNMGQGLMIITPEPEKVIDIAYSHEINAQVVGEVQKEKGIRIDSKGRFKRGQMLRF